MNNSHRSISTAAVVSLLTDNAWFARLATALVTGDTELQRDAPKWAPVATPSEAVERNELRLTLLNAVLALDEPYRGVVVLHFIEDRDAAAIARLSSTDERTVRSQLSEGITRLRAIPASHAASQPRDILQ